MLAVYRKSSWMSHWTTSFAGRGRLGPGLTMQWAGWSSNDPECVSAQGDQLVVWFYDQIEMSFDLSKQTRTRVWKDLFLDWGSAVRVRDDKCGAHGQWSAQGRQWPGDRRLPHTSPHYPSQPSHRDTKSYQGSGKMNRLPMAVEKWLLEITQIRWVFQF